MGNNKLVFLVEGKSDALFLHSLCNRLQLNTAHYLIEPIKGNKDGLNNIPIRLENALRQYCDYVIIIDSDDNLNGNLKKLDNIFAKKQINITLSNKLEPHEYLKHNIFFNHHDQDCNLDLFAFHDNKKSNPCQGTYECLLFQSINDDNEYKKLITNTWSQVNTIYEKLIKQGQIDMTLASKIQNNNNIYKRKLSIYLSLHHKCYESPSNGLYNPFAIYENPKTFGLIYGEILQPLEEYEDFIKAAYDMFLDRENQRNSHISK